MDSSCASNASLTVANGEFALCGSAIVWALADIVADVAEVGRDAGLADAGLEGGFDGAWDVSPKLVSYTASLLNKMSFPDSPDFSDCVRVRSALIYMSLPFSKFFKICLASHHGSFYIWK